MVSLSVSWKAEHASQEPPCLRSGVGCWLSAWVLALVALTQHVCRVHWAVLVPTVVPWQAQMALRKLGYKMFTRCTEARPHPGSVGYGVASRVYGQWGQGTCLVLNQGPAHMVPGLCHQGNNRQLTPHNPGCLPPSCLRCVHPPFSHTFTASHLAPVLPSLDSGWVTLLPEAPQTQDVPRWRSDQWHSVQSRFSVEKGKFPIYYNSIIKMPSSRHIFALARRTAHQ